MLRFFFGGRRCFSGYLANDHSQASRRHLIHRPSKYEMRYSRICCFIRLLSQQANTSGIMSPSSVIDFRKARLISHEAVASLQSHTDELPLARHSLILEDNLGACNVRMAELNDCFLQRIVDSNCWSSPTATSKASALVNYLGQHCEVA